MNTDLERHELSLLCHSSNKSYPKSPRVSAAMKGMSFACVQSLISSCLLWGTPQRTMTYVAWLIGTLVTKAYWLHLLESLWSSQQRGPGLASPATTSQAHTHSVQPIGVELPRLATFRCPLSWGRTEASIRVYWQEYDPSITYLCTKILDSYRLRIVDCNRLHTRKDNVLCYILNLIPQGKVFKKMHYQSRRPSPARLRSAHLRRPSASSL